MKKERNIGTGKMKLMAVLFSICALTISQEPTKENKRRAKQAPAKVIVDTTTTVSRPADTLYLEQSIVLNKLDSLIQEKQKK